MTDKEKAKAYDKALERAQKATRAGSDVAIDIIQYIFPQLAESDDEKIIDTLIWLVEGRKKSRTTAYGDVKIDDILAWLEKQKSSFRQIHDGIIWDSGLRTGIELGKQKEHTPNLVPKIIRPKFAVGDTVCRNMWSDHTIREIYIDCDDPTYICINEEGIESHISFSEQDEWERKEQKPVENTPQLTVQGKGVYKICPRCKERMIRDNTKVYTSMPPQYGYKCPKCGEIEFDTAMYDNPEIEEQRLTSFYEPYNPDDYEVVTEGNATRLKKKEQKPVEWEWPNLSNCIKNCKKCHGKCFYRKEPYEEQKPADLSEMMIHKEPYIAPVSTPMVADEQKPIDYDAELEKCKHNFLYFWDKYVTVKLKTAKWSKEDEGMLQSIIKDFRDGNISSIGQEQWLKSLPERFNLQPKHWKPSVEQMKAFTDFVVGNEYDAHALAHLWAELKELSERLIS